MNELVMLSGFDARSAMLTLPAEEATYDTAQPECLAFDQTDATDTGSEATPRPRWLRSNGLKARL
jgi:hypothetical protein